MSNIYFQSFLFYVTAVWSEWFYGIKSRYANDVYMWNANMGGKK